MPSRILPARTSSVSRSITPSSALITSIRFSASLRAWAGVVASGTGAAAGCAGCRCGCCCMMSSLERILAGAVGLLQDQRAVDLVGNADAAGLRKRLGILLDLHRAPHAGAFGIAERAVALHAAGHLRKHLVEEHALEVGRGLVRLGLGLRRHLL